MRDAISSRAERYRQPNREEDLQYVEILERPQGEYVVEVLLLVSCAGASWFPFVNRVDPGAWSRS